MKSELEGRKKNDSPAKLKELTFNDSKKIKKMNIKELPPFIQDEKPAAE